MTLSRRRVRPGPTTATLTGAMPRTAARAARQPTGEIAPSVRPQPRRSDDTVPTWVLAAALLLIVGAWLALIYHWLTRPGLTAGQRSWPCAGSWVAPGRLEQRGSAAWRRREQGGGVPAGGRGGQEVGVVGVQAAAHRGQRHRRGAQRGVQPVGVDPDQPVPRGQRGQRGVHRRRPAPAAARPARPGPPGTSATRPYAVRLWCDTPRCRGAAVGVGDPQRTDRPAAQHGRPR